ncbi:MAG: transglutaminase domain-containing protein [Candidatus Aminicenantes bacterium]|nr:transglutaminase domain-containing protein [Candidatus Aminicenantes bacterium]
MTKKAWFLISLLLASLVFIRAEKPQETRTEIWMGLYMQGVKIGYNYLKEEYVQELGKKLLKNVNESNMRVSRLGSNPIDIFSVQESYFDMDGNPLRTLMRTKMSESETIIEAVIQPDKVIFSMGGEIVKEMPYTEKFYLGVPIEKIAEKDGFKPGAEYSFKILDPISYDLSDCSFKVLGKERVLILGEQKELWHVRSKINMIMPVESDDWLDENGEVWKSEMKTGFLSTMSIRMPREKAMAPVTENFDIAFSTVVKSNVLFENPLSVQKVVFKISGISEERIRALPYDGINLKLIKWEDSTAVIETESVIFSEKEAVTLPVAEPFLQKFLQPTNFVQSDDPLIVETAQLIIGSEKNSWRAAKQIAEWIAKELTPNYDVGFASARETIQNKEGDCSEHTVLMIALCRAAGIPARAAVGVMYGGGIFGYHMWPEVYAGRWVGLDAKWLAKDSQSGEYYTDATHIKLGESSLDENIFKEMVQAISEIIGKIKLEVLDYRVDQ